MAGYSRYNVSLGNTKNQIDFLKKLGVKILENLDLNSLNEGAASREPKKIIENNPQQEKIELSEKKAESINKDLKKEAGTKNPISIDLKDLDLRQAFVYSEIFGKPKCKRNNRW